MNAEPITLEVIEWWDSLKDPLGIQDGPIWPTDVRINGQSVLVPSDHPVILHKVELGSDMAIATVTMYVKSIVVEARPR